MLLHHQVSSLFFVIGRAMPEPARSNEEGHPDSASMDHCQPTGSKPITNYVEAGQRLSNGALTISQVVYIYFLLSNMTLTFFYCFRVTVIPLVVLYTIILKRASTPALNTEGTSKYVPAATVVCGITTPGSASE
jgi:hypothetical protein